MDAVREGALGPVRWWSGPLDVDQLAWRSVLQVRDAAAELAVARGLERRIEAAPDLVAASFAALENLRIDGRAPEVWGEFSGFVEARDGWVRLHGNYPHHAAVTRAVLGVEDRAGLERAVARRSATEVEQQITGAGGIAVAVRSAQEWREHPQHLATAEDPWARVTERGERPPLRPLRRNDDAPGSAGAGAADGVDVARGGGRAGTAVGAGPDAGRLPLDGVRILDLTRVLAGPTCTQLLACLGADVLRIDPPHRPEILDQHLSTGMGKRSAVLDLRDPEGRRQARTLAASADVILTGYRPGALARYGLGPDDLAALAPHAVIGVLSAWGETGPWGHRAGFDSIVQAATGIAVACGRLERPGALPVQALDHTSGHLLAAHVLTTLTAARARTIRVSLLGAAHALLALPAPPERDPAPLEIPRRRVTSAGTVLDAVPPPLLLDGRTIERSVGGYGAATPRWRP